MIQLTRRTAVKAMIVLAVACAEATRAGDWTGAVEVRHDFKRCVSYRARWDGEFLVVQATHEAGWHTYAMDNKQRAEEKLAGRESLGIDGPTEIRLTPGTGGGRTVVSISAEGLFEARVTLVQLGLRRAGAVCGEGPAFGSRAGPNRCRRPGVHRDDL